MPQKAIGSYIYLFTRSDSYSDEVVISAHGGRKRTDVEFDVKGTELRFYSVEGAEANASDLLCYPHMVKQTVGSGGTCMNYRLSKFQGSHGTASGEAVETYKSIQQTLDRSVERIKGHNDMLAMASADALKKAGLGSDPISQFDVATVRNRNLKSELRLKDMVEQLLGVHSYRVVHCSFCRVLM